jgi:hypothetical protein
MSHVGYVCVLEIWRKSEIFFLFMTTSIYLQLGFILQKGAMKNLITPCTVYVE